MHQSLQDIQQQLKSVIALVESVIPPESFAVNTGNWNFPLLGRSDLVRQAQAIIDLIDISGSDDVGDQKEILEGYVRRLQFLQTNVIPNIAGSPPLGVSVYTTFMDALREVVEPATSRDNHRNNLQKIKILARQIRSMEATYEALKPRTILLADKVDAIESAHDAAEQLPTDMEALADAKKTLEKILEEATQAQTSIQNSVEQIDEVESHLSSISKQADAVLARSETAFSAATSVGLAAAFSERSKSLGLSMSAWIAGLIAALVTGGFFGTQRLQALVDVLKDTNAASSSVVPNVMLSLLSIGGPIWFAWLSTKQIGQRFRLAEDYAYKASISRAYEGFRREAARVDPELERRLLTSAMDRLDEIPLRLVESESHGSPWNELANTEVVKQALRTFPDFAEQIKGLARTALTRTVETKIAKSDPVSPTVT